MLESRHCVARSHHKTNLVGDVEGIGTTLAHHYDGHPKGLLADPSRMFPEYCAVYTDISCVTQIFLQRIGPSFTVLNS